MSYHCKMVMRLNKCVYCESNYLNIKFSLFSNYMVPLREDIVWIWK